MLGNVALSLMQVRAKALLYPKGFAGILRQRPPDALPTGWNKLYFIYRMVRRLKPEVVVEYGAGNSTLAFAQALRDNGRGHLYSFDQSEYWLDVAWRMLPSWAREVSTLCFAPVEITEHNGQRVFVHQATSFPNRVDLWYLDSPPLQKPTITVAIDPIVHEDEIPVGGVLLVDGRWDNVRYLRDHLTGAYTVTSDRLVANTTFTRAG